MVFPVVMYGCESWTIKKAEQWRIDAFELWCWRILLRVPWTARRSKQSILKEIGLGVHWRDWCWSWNSNTLATWCEELTHWKRPWCWERVKACTEGDDGGWDGWMALPTQWTWVWVDSGNWWWTGRPGVLQFMRSQSVGHNWATELHWTDSGMGRQVLNNWIVAFASTCPGITFSDFLEIWLWRLGLHSHVIVFMVLSLRTPGPQQTLTQNYDLKMFYVWKNLEIKI